MSKPGERNRREPVLSAGESDPPRKADSADPPVEAGDPLPRHERGLFEPARGDIHPGPLEPGRPDGAIHQGPLEPSTTSEIHPGPLDPSRASTLQLGRLERSSRLGEAAVEPLAAAPAVSGDAAVTSATATATFETPITVEVENAPSADAVVIAKRKKSWREKRWERRRRRIYFEEALGWVLVPIILISCYVGVKGLLAAFGTTPTALIQGIQTALSSRP